MNNWFTVEKIDRDTYAISEYKHWEQIHSYLLMGKEKAVLIDTGMGIKNIKTEVNKLTNKPVTVITTHCHWDHIGGHNLFKNIYIHKLEARWLRNGIPIPLKVIKQNVLKFKLSKDINFNIRKYKVQTVENLKILEDGNVINLGNRKLKIIHTPGHSPGHICIYDIKKRYIFTGDILYEGIIFANYKSTDPKSIYQSIKKIYEINPKKILPGHNCLNLNNSIINIAYKGISKLKSEDKLKHGSGLHTFGPISYLF